MGQIADDILSGFQCSWCGICFTGEHGYPVLCDDCFKSDSRAAKHDGLSRATLPEIGEDTVAEPKQFGCEKCKRKFTTPQRLSEHYRVKHPELIT